jgi:hypothetical protein
LTRDKAVALAEAGRIAAREGVAVLETLTGGAFTIMVDGFRLAVTVSPQTVNDGPLMGDPRPVSLAAVLSEIDEEMRT